MEVMTPGSTLYHWAVALHRSFLFCDRHVKTCFENNLKGVHEALGEVISCIFHHFDTCTLGLALGYVPSKNANQRPGKSNLSRRMGKLTICIDKNKSADQLRCNCEADQHICFRYMVF